MNTDRAALLHNLHNLENELLRGEFPAFGIDQNELPPFSLDGLVSRLGVLVSAGLLWGSVGRPTDRYVRAATTVAAEGIHVPALPSLLGREPTETSAWSNVSLLGEPVDAEVLIGGDRWALQVRTLIPSGYGARLARTGINATEVVVSVAGCRWRPPELRIVHAREVGAFVAGARSHRKARAGTPTGYNPRPQ